MEIDALEFLRRFLEHVLPPGFQKVRHYGFLSPHSAVSLEQLRALVAAQNAAIGDANPTVPREPDARAPTATPAITEPTCSYCGHRLRVIAIVFHRVSFRDSA
jgi:hypothetical protein